MRSLLLLLLALPAAAADKPKLSNRIQGPFFGCTDKQRAAIEKAAPEAAGRVWKVKMAESGVGPAADDSQARTLELKKRQTDRIAEHLFGKNDTDLGWYLTSMYSSLVGKLDVRCAPKGDKDCGNRSGYVRRGTPVIWTCPNFFSEGEEQRVRTLVHESAHVAGIGESGGTESYCVYFDCDGSCGKGEGQGTSVADNWSHFVHCASGQEPDEIEAITASPKKP